MESARFLKITIVVLLLINISTLVFMWYSKQNHPHHMPPPPNGGPGNTSEFLIRELNLDENQQKQFFEMRDKHREAVHEIQEKSGPMHHRFFELLKKVPADSVAALQLADSMSMCQKQIELLTFNHFKKVREICNAQQQTKFDGVIQDALRMMAPKPPGGR